MSKVNLLLFIDLLWMNIDFMCTRECSAKYFVPFCPWLWSRLQTLLINIHWDRKLKVAPGVSYPFYFPAFSFLTCLEMWIELNVKELIFKALCKCANRFQTQLPRAKNTTDGPGRVYFGPCRSSFWGSMNAKITPFARGER